MNYCECGKKLKTSNHKGICADCQLMPWTLLNSHAPYFILTNNGWEREDNARKLKAYKEARMIYVNVFGEDRMFVIYTTSEWKKWLRSKKKLKAQKTYI